MANPFKTHPIAIKMQRLYNKNSTISGVPYVFLYYYVPVKYQHDEEYSFTQEVKTSCHKIWNFKDGIDQEWAIDAVAEVLNYRLYNGVFNTKLTFVCIPASTISSNNLRFKYFSAKICNRLRLQNGFDYINIVKEKTPKHISGVESESELEIDPFFFAGKDIILFDDVVTKGHSMQKLMQKLQAVNAKTVLCLSLGKTYFPPVTTINPINPYTGNHLLVASQEQTDDCITIDTTKPNLPPRSAYSSDIYGTANSSTSASAFGSTSKPNVGSAFGSTSKPNAGSASASTSKPNAGSAFGSVSSSVHVDINKNTGYQLYENREQNGAKILKELQSLNDDKEVIKRIKSLNDNELKTVLHYINENESNTKSNYNSDNRITYTIDSSSKGSGSYISGNSIKGSGSYTNSGSDDDSGSYTSSGSGNNSGCVVIIILIILFIFVF